MSVTFYGYIAETETIIESGDVNMANANAAFVLDSLGLPTDDLSGGLPADDFLGRVLMALAVAPQDEGVPAYDDTRPGGPQWTECGRREGYLQDQLEALRELTEQCPPGAEVAWA